ncbi:MAG: DNA alkylation repair protein, partial [Candidatus Dormibacteraeota bacterium]|nr:DNA alkylation repair protein [Candidatus Dormibacteraeota bacterium]
MGNPTRAVEEKRYLKSDLAFYGCGLNAIRTAVRQVKRDHPDLEVARLRRLVRLLWKDPTFERRIAAVLLLDAFLSLLTPQDIKLVERLIRESETWALVDELSGVIASPLVERYPELNRTLDQWAVDQDFWVRRSALLALLRPLRRGGGDFPRFGGYADRMLDEREFFIRKAIGWVL